MPIRRFEPESEFWTPERCFITELRNVPGDEDCSMARARVQPGVTTEWHRLRGVTEHYVILEGQGLVEVGGGEPRQVSALDVVSIPASTPQRITNTGDGDLTFLCVCLPRWVPESYESLE
jgi:mannose-6-phosphate isomerase-like protein (cupin superfamily)